MKELIAIAQEMQPRTMAARDWVFQVLRTAIVRNKLPGGMPLRQDEVSAALNVSHIPVREAFRQLEAQWLVRIYPNRGAVVSRLTATETQEIMDTRIILELGALRTAFPNVDRDTLRQAQAYIDAAREETDINREEELNQRFHIALYRPAGNQALLRLIDQLHANVDRYIRPFYSEHELYSRTCEEHQALLDAVAGRDQALADALLRTHLESTKRLLLHSPALQENRP